MKHILAKGENASYQVFLGFFPFSDNVFKRPISKGRKKSALSGKGLTYKNAITLLFPRDDWAKSKNILPKKFYKFLNRLTLIFLSDSKTLQNNSSISESNNYWFSVLWFVKHLTDTILTVLREGTLYALDTNLLRVLSHWPYDECKIQQL